MRPYVLRLSSLSFVLSALLIVASAAPVAAAISYGSPTFLSTGSEPTAIAVGDFNNDCNPDFATADQGSSTVTIHYGNGHGGFGPAATYSTNLSSPVSIVAADFNNDGVPDLAVGNANGFDPVNGRSIAILLNNGSGTFSASTPLTTSGGGLWLATGDINEDGNADLMVIDSGAPTYGVQVYAGDGTGHFGAPSSVSTGTHQPVKMIVTDLNGDHHADLVVVTGDAMLIYLGHGDGSFSTPATFLFPDPINGYDGASHVAAADLNHDGHMDLVTTAGNWHGGVTVFLGDGSGTNFSRSRFEMANQATNPIFVALADLDGDGNVDIVVANQFGCTPEGSNLTARAGHGDGTFGPIVVISVGYGPTCLNSHWNPNAIAAVDLNCDGAADLIVPNLNQTFCSLLLTAGGTDTQAPTLTVPPSISVDAASCPTLVTDAEIGHATASDNCSSCVVVARTGVPAGNLFPVGITTIHYTATDGSGNSAAGSQTVTIIDNTAPSISAPANVTVNAGSGCIATVNPGTATATDNCGSPSVTGTRSDVLPLSAPYPVGTTTIVWTATDGASNTATASQTVTVVDATPPSIAAPANVSVTADSSCVATVNPGVATAIDNCSSVTVTGTRSDSQPLTAPYPVGTTAILWTATDAHGNSSTASQTITVAAPPIVISGVSATPAVLWPPQHQMVSDAIAYSVTGCGTASCAISSVTSNEAVNGLGDGDQSPDWQIVDSHHVLLRAERSGTGSGRMYTITISCSDSANQTTTTSVQVTVPKNQK